MPGRSPRSLYFSYRTCVPNKCRVLRRVPTTVRLGVECKCFQPKVSDQGQVVGGNKRSSGLMNGEVLKFERRIEVYVVQVQQG
jgi:hypothetical protein